MRTKPLFSKLLLKRIEEIYSMRKTFLNGFRKPGMFPIKVTLRADRQTQKVASWWLANRPKAPAQRKFLADARPAGRAPTSSTSASRLSRSGIRALARETGREAGQFSKRAGDIIPCHILTPGHGEVRI